MNNPNRNVNIAIQTPVAWMQEKVAQIEVEFAEMASQIDEGVAIGEGTYTSPYKVGSHYEWWYKDSNNNWWYLIKFSSPPDSTTEQTALDDAEGYFPMSPALDCPDRTDYSP